MRFWFGIGLALVFCVAARATEPAPFIVVDQFGYLPSLEKRAIIRNPQVGFDADRTFSPGPLYAVTNLETGEDVYRGRPQLWKQGRTDDVSGDQVWWFDFSSVVQPGRYVVRDIENNLESDPFAISRTVYRQVLRDAFRVFYYQRAGFEKRAPFAAPAYQDAASHLRPGQDSEAQRYDAEGDRSTARDLHGGWFDAGDYNQYTSWTADYVSSLIAAYRENPTVWTDAMGIPESGNNIPDILDEVRWGLSWLERMQNEDGSMLSVLGRAEGSPPSRAKGPSLYGLANTSSTLSAAGAFATAAETFSHHADLQGLVPLYRAKALKAWGWAEANPKVKFYNNSDKHGTEGLGAGQQEVDQDRLARKRLIAAARLFLLTGEKHFLRVVEGLYSRHTISADTANGYEGDLAFTLLRLAQSPATPRRFSKQIKRDYETALAQWSGWGAVNDQADAYGAYVDGYWWGSNRTKSRRGSMFTQSVLGGIEPHRHSAAVNAASHYLHYLHGVNPMGLVYLTNMEHAGAERPITTIYHAWFHDGSRDYDQAGQSRFGPAPGFLAGGPNASYSRDKCCPNSCGHQGDRLCQRGPLQPPEGQPPAKSYADFNDDWPLNSWEVTEPSLSYQAAYLRLLSKFVR
jgi:hypothetical protein